MDTKQKKTNRSSLDPENWDDLRKLGHEMLDDAFEYLGNLRSLEHWKPVPTEYSASFSAPVPESAQSPTEVYREFKSTIRPYVFGNNHPRFWGYALGAGCPVGMLAELLKASMNAQAGGYDNSAIDVELQVLAWLKTMFGFPTSGSGILVSGGSKANLIGLTIARNSKADVDIRSEGVFGSRKMTAYSSSKTHASVRRAIEVLGLGSKNLRNIPTDENFKIRIDLLRKEIEADLSAGHRPFLLIGNAGTTSTGSVDDLLTLSEIAREFDLWFHVDGAIGAPAVISPRFAPLFEGMNSADSLTIDLHKWFQQPIEAACVLVRSHDLHHKSFAWDVSYLPKVGTSGRVAFGEMGIDLTREFRALKVWMSLRTHGLDKFRRLFETCVDQAQHLATRIKDIPCLEVVSNTGLNIVCFRYVKAGASNEQIDELNKLIISELKSSGAAFVTQEILSERIVIRVCNINHRSTMADFDDLIETVCSSGDLFASRIG